MSGSPALALAGLLLGLGGLLGGGMPHPARPGGRTPSLALLAALGGLGVLALALGGFPWWTPQATLGWLTLATVAPVLAGGWGRPAARLTLLLGGAGALAAAWSLPLASLAASGRAPLTPAWIGLLVLGLGGLALAALLLAADEQPGGLLGAPGAGRSVAIAGLALLALALLPGLHGATAGGGFGLLPDQGGLPLLGSVLAGERGEGGLFTPADLHRLPLRLPLPWASEGLLLAALALGLAGGLGMPALGAERRGALAAADGARPRLRAALFLAGGGLLLAVAAGVALAGLLPAQPLPTADQLTTLLDERLGQRLPTGWRLLVEPWGVGQAGFTPLGAGFDLALLLLAGGASLAEARRLGRSVRSVPPLAVRRPRGSGGTGALDRALATLALALAVVCWVCERATLAGWARDPHVVGLGLALGLTGLARLLAGEGRNRTAAWLLRAALFTALATLLAAGRGGAGASPLLDALTL